MTKPHLPTWATVQEAADWLHAETGEHWPLPRLVESGAAMGVWFDCAPDEPADWVENVFQGRREGFMASIVFGGDVAHIAAVRSSGTLTMTRRPDGELLRLTPPARFTADDLRFAAAGLREIAAAACSGASGAAAPASAGVVKHSTKTARRDPLDPAIELAQSLCRNPRDTAEVWGRLKALAQDEHPPLLAVTPAGLKYTGGGAKSAYFNRGALDKRLHPEKRKARR